MEQERGNNNHNKMKENEEINRSAANAVVRTAFWSIIIFAVIMIIFVLFLPSCSPKIVYQKETITEYRDRVVHDTATFEVPVEVVKIVTRDTVSRLNNSFAKSDAIVSGGFLFHSLESIPQTIEVPVEVHVTDTLWKEQEIKEVEKEVEKELTWWQKFRMRAFWWLLLLCGGLLVLAFRKPLLKFISSL